jgi:hypothetical protein
MAKKITEKTTGEQTSGEKNITPESIKTSIYVPNELWAIFKDLATERTRAEGRYVTLNTVMVSALQQFVAGGKKPIDTQLPADYDAVISRSRRQHDHWIKLLLQILDGNNPQAISAVQQLLQVLVGIKNVKQKNLDNEIPRTLAKAQRTLQRIKRTPGDGGGMRRPGRRTA